MCLFVIVNHYLCFRFSIGNIIHTCKGCKSGIVGLVCIGCPIIDCFITHICIAFKSVFRHHVIGQFLTLCLSPGEFGNFIKHGLEQGVCKCIGFGFVHARQTIFAQVCVFKSVHILNVCSLAKDSLHSFFKSEHTILRCFL